MATVNVNIFAYTYNGMHNWHDRFMQRHNKSGIYTSETLSNGKILVFKEGIQWAVYDPKKATINTNAHVMKVQW